jgi:hypothetical protein
MSTEASAPAMWDHLKKIYEFMESHSEETTDNEQSIKVYEGFTTRMFQEASVPVPYYGKILDALTEMGCISQLRRGGGTSPSMWALWKPPEYDAYMVIHRKEPINPKIGKSQVLEQRMDALEARLQGLDIARALGDFQIQMDELRSELKEVKDEVRSSEAGGRTEHAGVPQG